MKMLFGLFALATTSALGAVSYHAASEQSASATRIAAAPKDPVLVELFTSQGCSSCPPADRFAGRLAREPGLVVISRPVTYWDRLGWKDTLARGGNSDLQRAYARRGLAGRNGVFTPQIVVDGNRGAVGSNEAFVRRMITKERSAPAAIAIREQVDGSLAVGIAGRASAKAELVVLPLDAHVTVRIARGENGNRAIGYTNVVLDERVLSDWSGGKKSLALDPSQYRHPGADLYAFVLREKNAGPVLATRLVG